MFFHVFYLPAFCTLVKITKVHIANNNVLSYNLHMENFVRKALDEYGITPSQAHKLGMPYQSVYRQYRGQRRPSGEFALLYEELLGIPREKIRPDLWPPEPAPAREEVSA